MENRVQLPAAANWVADPDFDGRAVNVIEYDRPASMTDDAVTSQSVATILNLANRDAGSPAIRKAVIEATRNLPTGAPPRAILDAVWNYAASHVRYQHEEAMRTQFSDLANFIYDQTIIAPAALLAMPQPEGDCVDFSALVIAMCRALGIAASPKTIAAAPASLSYSHVYVIAEIVPGQWYALDASNGPGPGFEYALPPRRKRRIWPDPAQYTRPRPKGTAMIHRTAPPRLFPLNPRRTRPPNVRGRGRLGDVSIDESGIPYDLGYDPGTSYDPGSSLMTGPNVNLNDPALQIDGSTGANTGTGPGLFTKIATTLINDATSIAAPLIRQNSVQAPYYITGANGAQILYDPSTGRTANAGFTSGINSAIGGLPTSVIIYGLAALATLAVIFSSSPKR